MSTKIEIAAITAVLATLATTQLSFAQQKIFYPPLYAWQQSHMTNVPGEARASVPRTRSPGWRTTAPYGQW
jgi:hypothetical protein